MVPYSPSSEEEEELIDGTMDFHDIQDNSAISDWHGIINSIEVPSNIDDFFNNYFNVEPSTVEQSDLSPNTI